MVTRGCRGGRVTVAIGVDVVTGLAVTGLVGIREC
jgi:hypothetical protein